MKISEQFGLVDPRIPDSRSKSKLWTKEWNIWNFWFFENFDFHVNQYGLVGISEIFWNRRSFWNPRLTWKFRWISIPPSSTQFSFLTVSKKGLTVTHHCHVKMVMFVIWYWWKFKYVGDKIGHQYIPTPTFVTKVDISQKMYIFRECGYFRKKWIKIFQNILGFSHQRNP